MQSRGVVHYHVIFLRDRGWADLGTNSEFHRYVAQAWNELSDPWSQAHAAHGTLSETAGSVKRIRSYVVAYLTDPGKGDDVPHGRQWGRSATLATDPLQIIELCAQDALVFQRYVRRLLHSRMPRSLWWRGYLRWASLKVVYMDYSTAVRILHELVGVSMHDPPPEVLATIL